MTTFARAHVPLAVLRRPVMRAAGVALFALLLLLTQLGRLAHACPMEQHAMAATASTGMSVHCAQMAAAMAAGTAGQCADHCKGGAPAVDGGTSVSLPVAVYLALFVVGVPLPLPASTGARAWRERGRRRDRSPPERLRLLQGRLRH